VIGDKSIPTGSGTPMWHQAADFLEVAVLVIGVADSPLTRVEAAEDRNLDPAIFALALDPPITARHAISKDLGLQVIVGHLNIAG
jgi:hypothetical protein